MLKKSSLALGIGLAMLCCNDVYAHNTVLNTQELSERIVANSTAWFDYLQNQIIVHYPKKGTEEAELDRQISWSKQYNTSPERYNLAIMDKNQSTQHVRQVFREAALADFASSISDEQFAQQIAELEYLSADAIYVPNRGKNGRARAYDFILKDHYLRGRPYQVMDKKTGQYLEGYDQETFAIVNGKKSLYSSYPSGHTSHGFGQAVVMALAFPERGQEIFSRALQYGESRVIVGAHFPTDTMTSRLARYYYMAQLLNDTDIAQGLAQEIVKIRQPFEQQCQKERLADCLLNLSNELHQKYKSEQYDIGYYHTLKSTPSLDKLPVEQLPEKAEALLKLRFNYLNDDARRQVLASTAYPINSLAQMGERDNPNHHWGLINLPRAYDGVAHLYRDMITQDADPLLDIAQLSKDDTWHNDITGEGRLILNHQGRLTLTGNNTFAGVTVNKGILRLLGENKLQGESEVHAFAQLDILGQMLSKIKVADQGVLNVMNSSSEQVSKVADVVLQGQRSQLNLYANPQSISVGKLSGDGVVNIDTFTNQDLPMSAIEIDQLSGQLQFKFNQPLSKHTALNINHAQGQHKIQFNDTNALSKNAEIKLLRLENYQAQFNLVNQHGNLVKQLDQGVYGYRLKNSADTAARLSTLIEPKVVWLSHLDEQGRFIPSSPVQTAMMGQMVNSSMLQASDVMLNDKDQSRLWANMQYQKQQVHADGMQFDLISSPVSAGYHHVANPNTQWGAYMTYQQGNTASNDSGQSDVTATSLGGYVQLQWSPSMSSMAQVQWGKARHHLKSHLSHQDTLTADVEQQGLSGRLSTAYLWQTPNYRIQPSLSLVYTQLQDAKFHYHQQPELQMNMEKQHQFKTQLAVDASRQIHLSTMALEPYAHVAVYHQKQLQNLNAVDESQSQQQHWQTDLSGLGLQVGMGVKAKIGNQVAIQGELQHHRHEYYRTPLQASLAVHYQF